MLRNYWIVTWRSLVRNKIYSLFNVLGLSLGICACLAVYLIVSYEFSFDDFHQDRDRIFTVDAVIRGGHWNCIPGPMPAAMRREMTGFQTVAAFQTYAASVTIPGDAGGKPTNFGIINSIAIVESQYFDIFRYRWLSGNAATSLNRPNSVVLTAERARKYFGDLNADEIVGRTIHYQDSLVVTVTGVVADWTGNSDFNFSEWISYATIPASFLKDEITLDNWDNINRSSQVMIKLAKGVNPTQFDAQFVDFAKRHFAPKSSFSAYLKPFSGIHFHQEYGGTGPRASLSVLYTLVAVAGFILLLAIVNFVNLSTAQSTQRAREIGLRKVLGGNGRVIAVQFFAETFMLTVAAVVLATLMATPVFNLFADLMPPGIRFRLSGATILFLIFVIMLTTLLAGFYPAKVLGSYQPTLSLKGITAVSGSGKGTLRRGLIVFQFTISLLFIIASLVMGAQLRYVLHADLGFTKGAIITLSGPRDTSMSNSTIRSDRSRNRQPASIETAKIAVLMEKIGQLAGVEQVIRQWKSPMDKMHSGFGGGALKNSSEPPIDISFHYGNEDYVRFYGMKVIAGRNFFPSDSGREVLISETCARALGFTDVRQAIGREIVASPVDLYPIAGVVADFYENSFHEASWPVVIRNDPGKETVIAVKIAARSMSGSELNTLIGQMEESWKAVFPDKLFAYSFLEDSIAGMYANDLRTGRLTNLAMGITVFISCLGLLGLAIFSTERRAREIGIRKVLGATVSGVVMMLCKEIVLLILLALLIAVPFGWYIMHEWLQGFAYRTALSVWMFFGAGATAIGLALLTVGFQAMRAAMADPIRSLRTE
jgi:putative ABC transport system permease protein